MNIILIISLIQIIYINAKKCDHDHDEEMRSFHKKLSDFYFKNQENDPPKRNLQTSTPQPYRITFDFSPIDQVTPATITQTQRQFLQQICESARVYFSHLIKVVPQTQNNRFPTGWSTVCLNVPVPAAHQTTGVPNSDMHIYVTYQNNAQTSVLASASFCAVDPTLRRPNFGRIQFNIAMMQESTLSSLSRYEDRVETTIHEILHVLGFSSFGFQYFINPARGVAYGANGVNLITSSQVIRNITTNILFSPNVLEVARRYYNCSSIQGMQLENGGGAGTAGSHWEQTIISNEMMNGQAVPTDAALSIFTVALLRDTGFYAEINENFAENIYWGRNKGCDFFNNACRGIFRYQEFVRDQIFKGCTFDYHAGGTGANPATLDGCFYVMPFSNRLCTNPDNNGSSVNRFKDDRYETYGTNSRCINSTASSGAFGFTDSTRCHSVTCSPDQSFITITIDQLKRDYQCTRPSQIIELVTGNSNQGQIVCPENFAEFCDFQPVCRNFCNGRGVCIRGFCICTQNWAGEDCSVQCPNFIEGTNCVNACSAGNHAGIDKVCRPTCFRGFYRNNGICSQCHSSCSACTGPSATECTSCQFMTFLNGNTCVNTCPSGTVASQATRTCQSCGRGCLACNSPTQCTQCDTSINFVLNSSGTCTQTTTCNANCLGCTTVATQCTRCATGLFLDRVLQRCVAAASCPSTTWANTSNNECTNCTITGCTRCINETNCDTCNTSLGFRKIGTTCTNCVTPCATCQATNLSNCLTCENTTLFVSNFRCVSTCPKGTYPDQFTRQCTPCRVQGCLACTSEIVCTECDSTQTFVLSNNTCVKTNVCDSPCRTCYSTDRKMCTSCIQGYYLFYQDCFLTCPQETYLEVATGICQWCQYGCLQCVNDTKCTVCDTQFGWRLFGDFCVEATDCYSPCRTCVSYQPTTCTSCISGRFLSSGRCLTQCPNGTRPTTGIC